MIVSIKKLSKTFSSPSGLIYALKEISLSIRKKSVTGIIGGSGAGKSTLIRCLTGLEKPTEGGIWIGGSEISGLKGKPLRTARRKIGMVFQQFNLFSSRTAWQNVAYPLEISGISLTERKKKACELLELVGLPTQAYSFPAQLSGGQQQRVAIARALSSDPDLLLCDEATSSLDPRTTQSILELLLQLNQSLGLTILCVTHEMEVVKRICTDVVVLEQGEIVEEGAVESVFASPQHPTTRHFLQNLSHEVPLPLLAHRKGALVRLYFKGPAAEKPIISRLIKQFDIEVNILVGGIDCLRRSMVGNLLVELTGAPDSIEKARHFLQEEGVICEEER